MNGVRKSLLLWGAILLAGFGIFSFWQTSVGMMNAVLVVLGLVGWLGTRAWVRNALSKRALVVFFVLFGMGVLMSMVWETGVLPVAWVPAPFVSLWLVLFGVGFAWAGHYFKEHAWYTAAILQAVVLAGIWLNVPLFGTYSFAWLGLVTGLPLWLIGFKH